MAQERISMRKIKEVFRLKYECGLSDRQIAKSCNIARSTIGEYISRLKKTSLKWEELNILSNEEIEQKLFLKSGGNDSLVRPLPDFSIVHDELQKNKHLTCSLLWTEYQQAHPNGYSQSWFYWQYRKWKKQLSVTMRQVHKGGEKLFVDYCDGLTIYDSETGAQIETQLFVAVWGASNYTYVQASLSQDLPSWIDSHVKAFEYFGVVPQVTVPDNLKSGVTKACRYEPDINPTYHDLATYYGFAVIPARPRKPRDKAKVEVGVQIAQRWILASLRSKRFSSITELNIAIRELLDKLNNRLLKKLNKSRHELFLNLDLPNAKSLPDVPYEYAAWKKAKVNVDYHIEIEAHYYSVPYRLRGQAIDVRLTTNTVELFFKGERIAAHMRSCQKYSHTTKDEHMPVSHQRYSYWTPGRILAWAKKIGPFTEKLVEAILSSRKHPEQGYRSALGVMRLEKSFGALRKEPIQTGNSGTFWWKLAP